ncbi:EamA family transporter [Nitrolancea hollandica]|uniref:EamA domain-containing protein n=1 Tax=Nitrolancea hollandica Lb TaxID=1129897 RepID=I4EJT1_9BACT|nr:EamA family transporter [Nitrolancea hollandica]CCF84943.1 conserved membrane hypothetical protein [Nitrolancea hollandica Lb]
MLIGIILILASAAAYNSAPVLLALEARSRLDQRGTSLVAGVLQGSAGLLGMVLGAVGWVLQLLALTRISVTLAWVLGASGVIVLLLLSHWLLHEPVGRQQVLGIMAITAGMVAVGLIHPARSATLPALNHWLVLLFLLTPVVMLPFASQILPAPRRPLIAALAAGTAYAVCNLLTKGLADLLSRGQFAGILERELGSVWTEDWFLPTILFAVGVAVFTVLGFMDELHAIQRGRAASLVPVIGGLQTIIPILLAPAFFDEHWPGELWARVILGLGILLAVTGSFVLSRGSAMELAHQTAEQH